MISITYSKDFFISLLLTTLTMAALITGLISGFNSGFSDPWPEMWMTSFLIAWPFAIVLSLTVIPQVRKLSIWLASIGQQEVHH